MAITDIRYTVLQTVNEVLRKIGLDPVVQLSQNKISQELVDHVNDIVSDLSDFGNWMETKSSAIVTAQVSVRDYAIHTSAVIKNIGDIYISTRTGPMSSLNIQDMRIMTRVTSQGTPSQYCIYGTDANGNPLLRFNPVPDQSNNGALFSVLYYTKPSLYTTADNAVLIPFPARVVVLGVLASYTLRQNSGAPNDMYSMFFKQYVETRRENLSRFNSDTGWDVQYGPARSGRRRR
jgi:hypothetical protein